MQTLDALDRKLLATLDRNSRQSMSTLARTLRRGRDTVEYRYERLKERGVIRRPSAMINPSKLGLTVYKTYLKLENRRSRLEEFLDHLQKHPRVYWIAESDGRWDMMASVFASSPHEFYDIQDKLLSKFHDIVLSFDVFTLVNLWVSPKAYFGGAPGKAVKIGGQPESYRLNNLEYGILKLLAEDSRLSTSAIAETLESTPAIIAKRISSLEESGVIAGYRLEVNLAELGMTFFKAQLYLRHYQKEQVRALREYCRAHPNVTYFIEQLGDCRLEIEIEVENYESFLEIIKEMRAQHCGLIRNIETNLIAREYLHWIPRGIRLFAQPQ